MSPELTTMYRDNQKIRVFLSVLLSLALLGWPGTSFGGS